MKNFLRALIGIIPFTVSALMMPYFVKWYERFGLVLAALMVSWCLWHLLNKQSVRIEPKSISFKGTGEWAQKSFRIVNDTDQPIYSFRTYIDIKDLSLNDVDIELFKEYQNTANQFVPKSQNVVYIFGFTRTEKQVKKRGKVVSTYCIDARKDLRFYISARQGVVIKFDPVEWEKNESGVNFQKLGENQPMTVPAPLPSNIGDKNGKVLVPGEASHMKVMLFKNVQK